MDINYYEEEFYDFSGKETKRLKNPNYIPGCKRTYLVQRLKSPDGDSGFAFMGGGLLNLGFNAEAWKLVNQLCSFDYMGSAEFEHGEVPETFKRMAENKDGLEAYLVTVSGKPQLPFPGRTVDHLSEIGYNVKRKVLDAYSIEASIFVLAPRTLRPHVEHVIKEIALDKQRLKEMSYMDKTLFTFSEWEADQGYTSPKTVGWLELDNGFAFFACETMWRNFCQLYDVEISPDVMEGFVEADFSAVDDALRAAAAQ